MTQQPLPGIYPENHNQKTHVPQCLLQHSLQQAGHGSNECPLTDEWIKKPWGICTVKYYSAIDRVNVSVVVIWMKLEPVTPVSKSEKEKQIQNIKAFYVGSRNTVLM